MARKLTSRGGKFIYALVDIGDGARLPRLEGLGRAPVHVIGHARIGAVVSDLCAVKVRPERRHLTAHQAVLRQLGERGTVLPMRFGVLAQGEKAVLNLLEDNEREISAQLRELEGKVEMGLRVKWQVNNIYEYFVETHPELARERDRCLQREATNSGRSKRRDALSNRDAKIELGRLYERLLQAQRAAHRDRVASALRQHGSAIRDIALKNKCDVMNLACLVDRDRLAEFEKKVMETSTLFDDHYLFNYSGPWAPHNFVDIHLDLPRRRRDSRSPTGADSPAGKHSPADHSATDHSSTDGSSADRQRREAG
jgi:hypothetical protein